MKCPCQSEKNYQSCCGQYLDGPVNPPNAEALMRARYSAYTKGRITYITQTMAGKAAIGFNPIEAKQWATSVEWLGLVVFSHQQQDATHATVTFAARFKDARGIQFIYETSQFEKINQRWSYIDGLQLPLPSRNEACLCGSGKKFKRCCSN